MTTEEWAGLIVVVIGSGGITGLLSSLLVSRESRRAGVAADKREAERDGITTWKGIAEKHERDLDRMTTRRDDAEAKLESRAVTIRRMADHIDALEAQIRRLGDEPLPRPTDL